MKYTVNVKTLIWIEMQNFRKLSISGSSENYRFKQAPTGMNKNNSSKANALPDGFGWNWGLQHLTHSVSEMLNVINPRQYRKT